MPVPKESHPRVFAVPLSIAWMTGAAYSSKTQDRGLRRNGRGNKGPIGLDRDKMREKTHVQLLVLAAIQGALVALAEAPL